ncbi:hypothetical protein GOP47_0014494, partial [Adiantum capillus-veneris]
MSLLYHAKKSYFFTSSFLESELTYQMPVVNTTAIPAKIARFLDESIEGLGIEEELIDSFWSPVVAVSAFAPFWRLGYGVCRDKQTANLGVAFPKVAANLRKTRKKHERRAPATTLISLLLGFVLFTQAGKIIANLIVLGSGVLLRAFSQAYRQAIANASRTGVAQETVQNLTKSSKAMTEQEARMILGINEKASVEEMLQ